MQQKVSHTKSRRGCNDCKRRHIKCDEQTPSCANCSIRGITCVYPSRQKKTASKRWLEPKLQSADASRCCSELQVSSSSLSAASRTPSSAARRESSSTQTTRSSTISTPSAASFSSTPTSNRLLELELMNIWSCKSWLGLHAIKGCDALLLSGLPRNALEHSYLLNGIFSIAAIDLARQAASDKSVKIYTRAALEYGNQASTQFRTALTTATSTDIHLLYYFATLASVLNFAMPSRHATALENLDMSFNLFLGSFRIAGTDLDWLMKSPCSLALAAKQLPVSPALKDRLDYQTTVAIARMTSLSEAVRVPGRLPGEPGGFASEVPPYPETIAQAQDCFAQELDDPVKGFFLTVVAVGGRGFAAVVQQREPVALFIVMYWAVLMHRSGRDGQMWWIGATGRNLVQEISELLQLSPIGSMVDLREGIKWARREVELLPLAGSLLPDLPVGNAWGHSPYHEGARIQQQLRDRCRFAQG